MRLIIVIFVGLSVPIVATQESAGQSLRGFFKNLERHRPRGRILRDLFGDSNRQEQNRSEEERSRNAQQDSQTTPNPAYRGTPTPANSPHPSATGRSRRAPNATSQLPAPNATTKSPSNDKQPVNLGARVRESNGDGVLVLQIVPNSPAAEAGLQRGDRITKVGGLDVADQEDLDKVLEVLQQGDQIEVEYQRNGRANSEIISFGEAPTAGRTENPTHGDKGSIVKQNRWHQSSRRERTPEDTSGRDPSDYDPIEAPRWNDSSSSSTRQNSGLEDSAAEAHESPANRGSGPVSVLGDLHRDSTPTPQATGRSPAGRNTDGQNTAGHAAGRNTVHPGRSTQIRRLQSIIQKQRQVIRELQQQIKQMRAARPNRPTPFGSVLDQLDSLRGR